MFNDSDSSGDRNPVDALAEEFAGRHRRGERPTIEEYVERFPDWEDDIRAVFPALVVMEQMKPGSNDVTGELPPIRQPLPERLGDYRIIGEIGRGGMGIVYEAEQQSLGRRVALKVLPKAIASDAAGLERFRRESRAAAGLHHTNIVPVFEVGTDGDTCYYAMQFIQGQPLDEVIRELEMLRSDATRAGGRTARPVSQAAQSLWTGGLAPLREEFEAAEAEARPSIPDSSNASIAALPQRADRSSVHSGRTHYWRSVAHLGRQVAEALAHAHARGVVHRDIKPSNLLLDGEGVVWVTDFGLAKTDDEGLTRTGDVLGTLRYMAPERFTGAHDARGDVYGLGMTLYEMLVLRPAYEDSDRLRLIEEIRTREPRRPRAVHSDIPRDLETIVLKAIDKDPARRYQTAKALAADLERFLEDRPIAARRVGPVERLTRWCRRNPLVATLAGSLLLALTLGLAGTTTLWFRAERSLMEATFKGAEAIVEARPSGYKGIVWPPLRWLEQSGFSNRPALRDLAAATMGDPIGLGPLAVYDDLPGAVAEIDVDPQGRWLAVSMHSGHVHLYDLRSGGKPQLLGPFEPTEDHVPTARVRFLDGGSLVLTLKGTRKGEDGLLDHGVFQFWRLDENGRWIPGAEHEAGHRIFSCAVTPLTSEDRQFLALGTVGEASLWDITDRDAPVQDSRSPFRIPEEIGGAEMTRYAIRLAIHPEGTQFAAVAAWPGRTAEAVVFDVTSGKATQLGFRFGLAYSPDGRWLAATGEGVRVLDAEDYHQVQYLHGDMVYGPAFAGDHTLVLPSNQTGLVRAWNVAGNQQLGALAHPGNPRKAAASRDGSILVTAASDSVRVWSWGRLAEMTTLRGHHQGTTGMAFAPDGSILATTGHDGQVRIWDAEGRLLKTLSGGGQCVAFNSDGSLLAAGGYVSSDVWVWETATWELLGQGSVDADVGKKTWCVTFCDDDRRLAVAGHRGLRLLELEDGVPQPPREDGTDVLAGRTVRHVEAAGSTLVWSMGRAGEDSHIRSCRLTGAKESTGLARIFSNPPGCFGYREGIGLVYLSDKREIVRRGLDGRLLARPLPTTQGQEPTAVTALVVPHRSRPWAAASTPGGRGIELWHLRSGERLFTLPDRGTTVWYLAWSPQGDRLAAARSDGTVQLWDVVEIRRQLAELHLDWQDAR